MKLLRTIRTSIELRASRECESTCQAFADGRRVRALAAIVVGALCIGTLTTAVARGPEGDQKRSKRKRDESKKHKASDGSASSLDALKRATKAVRSGDHATAERMIRAALDATHSDSVSATWRILEAEMEFARKNYAKAGLIAMRIVILQPDSEQVGPALYRAGKVYEKLGRPAKAIELYRECASSKLSSESMKKKAVKRAEALEPMEKS